MPRTLPTFLFIGPDKSGSTWLYELMQAHPQVFLPGVKETFFFDRYYDRGIDWYASKFAGRGPACLASGEICHDYLFSEKAAERIRHDIPDVRLIVMLREPVARTFSHWRFRRRSGDTSGSFEDDLKQTPTIFDHSCYSRHLAPYLDRFPHEQIGIFEFGELKTDPAALAARIQEFIGVEPLDESAFDTGVRRNEASTARFSDLVYALRQGGQMLRRAGLESVVGKVKSSQLVKRALYRPVSKGEKEALDPKTCAALEARFAPYNAQLEKMLGREIPELWRRKE